MATVTGTNGNDTVSVGFATSGVVPSTGTTNAADNISMFDGADNIRGGGGADTVIAGGGNDTLDGGEGNDTLDGGSGNDSIRASVGDDLINGGVGSDTIIASRGNDTINGGANDDRITGGFGSDSIVGIFGGNDTFVYTDLEESPAGAGDTIAGIDGIGAPGGDIFDLRQIDTTLTSVDDSFNFIGEAAFSAPFQLRVSNSGANTLIEGDVDGDRVADLQILVQDGTVVAAEYTAGDFLL